MNTNVIVLGASGAIGRVITARLVSDGHSVVAVARDKQRLNELAKRIAVPERLTVVPGSVAGDAEAARLAQKLRALHRPFSAVVVALRGPGCTGARLLDQPASFLQQVLSQDVLSHFVAAKHLLPLLAEAPGGGFYLLLSGPMADSSWAGYGHMSVATAALRMLTETLREEAKELPVNVQQLQITTPVRTELNAECCCPEWIGADEVARQVQELVQRGGSAAPIVRLGSYARARRSESSESPTSSRSLQ